METLKSLASLVLGVAVTAAIVAGLLYLGTSKGRWEEQKRKESCASYAGTTYYETCLTETEPD